MIAACVLGLTVFAVTSVADAGIDQKRYMPGGCYGTTNPDAVYRWGAQVQLIRQNGSNALSSWMMLV